MNYRPAVDLLVSAIPDLVAIYLFGSRARGDTTPESDVDIAILVDARLDSIVRFELQERIAACLHCNVDLVDLRAASPVIRVQVLEHGIVLFERDSSERQSFEATTLSAYTRLNEERRAIVDDIRRRGRVHG
jgi:predicted nucleotidyltransferase